MRFKEPVDLSSLTIEHVLPQTPTREWQQMVGEDLDAGEEFGQVHEAPVHTLGNLTLTGYNSEFSNSPLPVKRPQLASSGVLMNQEIAKQERWGRPQIHERADALAERVISEWPGPPSGNRSSPGTAWEVMHRALAELPRPGHGRPTAILPPWSAAARSPWDSTSPPLLHPTHTKCCSGRKPCSDCLCDR